MHMCKCAFPYSEARRLGPNNNSPNRRSTIRAAGGRPTQVAREGRTQPPTPVAGPLGSAAQSWGSPLAMGGNETNGGGARSSGSTGKLEVRPSERPVSLRDVSLPEVSSLTRAQMNWQLVRRVHGCPVKRAVNWALRALRRCGAAAGPRRAQRVPIASLPRGGAVAASGPHCCALQPNMPRRPNPVLCAAAPNADPRALAPRPPAGGSRCWCSTRRAASATAPSRLRFRRT